MSMNQLEKTIVANARAELAAVLNFYKDRRAQAQDNETTEEVDEHIGHFHTLYALLVFGHQSNSGMSEEGMQALREIEGEHAAALRKLGTADFSSDAEAGKGNTLFMAPARTGMGVGLVVPSLLSGEFTKA